MTGGPREPRRGEAVVALHATCVRVHPAECVLGRGTATRRGVAVEPDREPGIGRHTLAVLVAFGKPELRLGVIRTQQRIERGVARIAAREDVAGAEEQHEQQHQQGGAARA